MSKVAEGRARLAAPLTPERRQFIEDNAVSLLRAREEKIVRLQQAVVTMTRKARWAERRLAVLRAADAVIQQLKATRWTADERLRVLAILLAQKREHAMGRGPGSPLNFESLLGVAAAPDAVLDFLGPALDRFIEDGASRDALWAVVEADIRRMFPRHLWPAWLRA